MPANPLDLMGDQRVIGRYFAMPLRSLLAGSWPVAEFLGIHGAGAIEVGRPGAWRLRRRRRRSGSWADAALLRTLTIGARQANGTRLVTPTSLLAAGKLRRQQPLEQQDAGAELLTQERVVHVPGL